MQEGFRIAINWKSRKNVPNLPVEEILDKVADTIIEMSIENGKMARTLHEVLYRINNWIITNLDHVDHHLSRFLQNMHLDPNRHPSLRVLLYEEPLQ